MSQLCEAGFLTGNIAETQRYFTLACDMARHPMDTVHVHQVIIEHCTQGRKVREGLEIGRTFLASLGLRMPKNPHPVYQFREIMTARIRLSGKKPVDIRSLPVMHDKVAQAAAGILLDMGEASFIGYPEFFPLIASRLVNLSLKMGNSPASPYSYVTYGWMIMSVMGDIEKGFSIAETGLHLAVQLSASQLIAKTYFIYGAFVHPWKHSFSSAQEYLRKAVNSGSRYGDYSFASYALNHTLLITYCSGETLKRVIDLYKKYQPVMRGFQQESSIGAFRVWEEMITLLSDRDTVRKTGAHPVEIKAGYESEEALVKDWKAHHQMTNLGFLYTARLILGYHLGNFEEALEDARRCKSYLGNMVDCVLIPEYYFYHALVLIALSRTTGLAGKRRNLASARACEKKLGRWAKACPENFGPKHALVIAELAAAGNRSKNAIAVHSLYEKAEVLARESGFLHEEAIATDRHGAFALATGDAKRAGDFPLYAYRLYGQWDAGAKLAHLEESFPAINFHGSFRPPVIQTSGSFSEEIDTRSILKATHAISGEIYLGKLLPRLLSILIENTGAQRGFLLLEKETRLIPTAR